MADKTPEDALEEKGIEVVVEDDFEGEQKAMMGGIPVVPMDDEEEEKPRPGLPEDEEEEEEMKAPMPMMGAEAPPRPARPVPDEEEEEETPERRRQRLRQQLLAQLAALDEEEGKSAPEDVETKDASGFDEYRTTRLLAMGYKSEEIASFGDEAFKCVIENKVLTGSEPCQWCRGGCLREKGLPGLLDIEGKAEKDHGTVIDSGYAPADALFVVDVQAKDGKIKEIFYTDTGEEAGWLLLDQEMISTGTKSAQIHEMKIITVDDAETIATKNLKGLALSVSPAVFEGYDSYLVEVEGVNGKSYDAYVSLDGSFLGYDEYELEDDEEEEKSLETEATEVPETDEGSTEEKAEEEDVEEKAEEEDLEEKVYDEDDDDIEFKKFYSAEKRRELAGKRQAMPDGSFPIKDAADLKNAIRLAGNAKNPDAAKAHIMRRAAALGLEKLLPDSWTGKSEGADLDGFTKELMDFQMMLAEEETKELLEGEE